MSGDKGKKADISLWKKVKAKSRYIISKESKIKSMIRELLYKDKRESEQEFCLKKQELYRKKQKLRFFFEGVFM